MLLLFLTLDEMNTTISQSKIAQTSPPPSINLATVNLEYPLLPLHTKNIRFIWLPLETFVVVFIFGLETKYQ